MSGGRRWGKWTLRFAALAGAILLGSLFIMAWGAVSNLKWRRYVAMLRARGEPVTFQELNSRRAEILESENGARIVEELYEALHRVEENPPRLVFGGRLWEADFFEGIPILGIGPTREYLEGHAVILDSLDALRNRPVGRFDFEWNMNDPLSTLLPFARPVRAAAELEFVAGMLALAEEDADSARRHVEAIFHIAGTLEDEPNLIAWLIQRSISQRAVDALEQMLRVGELDEDTLRNFQCLVEHRLETDDIDWALRGERAMLVAFFDALVKGTVSWQTLAAPVPGQSMVFVPPTLPTFVLRENQLKTAQLMTELVDALGDRERLYAAARNVQAQTLGLSHIEFITKMLFPHFGRAIALHYVSKARLETARCALAWERYRLAKGSGPQSWDDLVPEFLDSIPPDWLTDDVVHLKISEIGTVFYSLGENRLDDGGEVIDQKGPQGQWRARDVGFRLVSPERRGLMFLDVPPPEDE